MIDDWVMAPLAEPERRDFWEICEGRYQVRSTILTSQLPVSRWHEQMATPRWPTVSSTAWFKTLIGLRCAAIQYGRTEASRGHSEANDLVRALAHPVAGRIVVAHPHFASDGAGQGASHLSCCAPDYLRVVSAHAAASIRPVVIWSPAPPQLRQDKG